MYRHFNQIFNSLEYRTLNEHLYLQASMCMYLESTPVVQSYKYILFILLL